MRLVKGDLLHSERIKRFVPGVVRETLRSHIDSVGYQLEVCRRLAGELGGPDLERDATYPSPYPVTVGIVKDHAYYYVYNVRACRDLAVRYRLLDISRSDWIERLAQCDCDAFLVWPSALISVWKQMYDERLRVLAQVTRKPIVPSLDELWLLDSKRRVREWLVANRIPHPRTEVFYDLDEAMAFLRLASYPVVYKTDNGASASGVFVVRNRRQGERMAKLAFGKGLRLRRGDRRDRQWGYLLVQEFVPHEDEWRVVRIGEQYLCRRKERIGNFASGSGAIGWAMPLPGMLDFVKLVTDRGGFESMAVDLFVVGSRTGSRFLVNELQCVFGAIVHQGELNEATGRWSLDSGGAQWRFEPGFFYQNACANLRVARLLGELGCS